MANMFTVSKDGSVKQGLDLQVFAQTLSRLAEKDPNATFDARQTWVFIQKGFGPAWVSISGLTTLNPVRREEGDAEDIYSLSPGDTLEIVHDIDVHASHRFQVFPSGEVEHTLLSTPASQGPKQAPKDAPLYVQEALNWLHDGEVGQSALALVQHLILVPAKLEHPSDVSKYTPSDASDWRRCWLLAQRIPYIRENIAEMANLSDDWADLVQPYEGSNGSTEWEQNMKKFDDNPPAPRPDAGPSMRVIRL